MSNNEPSKTPQKNSEPQEQEAVRTTIVGGRPPGSGKPVGNIPRGIEILVKKAAVDSKFRELLLKNPQEATEQLEIEIDDTELAMLQNASKEQLAQIIDWTNNAEQRIEGIRPDYPKYITLGISPDDPSFDE